MSLLFFDTEFTGLHKDTTLISIGIVADNAERFYAEFTDYNSSQCDDWIKSNVISNLLLSEMGDGAYKTQEKPSTLFVRGTKDYIKNELLKWLDQFDAIQFVSDVCHYDFVLLVDLFGTAFDLPEKINPACHDINQDIAKYYGTSEKEAFDMSREDMAFGILHGPLIGKKHNSLYDARVIRVIYNGIMEDIDKIIRVC